VTLDITCVTLNTESHVIVLSVTRDIQSHVSLYWASNMSLYPVSTCHCD